MLAKLLALVTQLKAAGVTAVIIAGATTVTVAGTSPEVQDTVQQFTSTLSQAARTDCDRGQPVVVAQRNAADKLLRAAFQTHQNALQDLRGGKGVDNQAVGAVVKKYDDLMRMRLDKALNDVAALTLGRVGQNRGSASPAPSASPSTSPSGSASPAPSCSPAPSASPTSSASASPAPSASGTPDQQGRVTVAERTTLEANLQSIVDLAIADMDAFVTSATAEVAAVPAPQRGKPSDNPGNKPENVGKPSASPRR